MKKKTKKNNKIIPSVLAVTGLILFGAGVGILNNDASNLTGIALFLGGLAAFLWFGAKALS